MTSSSSVWAADLVGGSVAMGPGSPIQTSLSYTGTLLPAQGENSEVDESRVRGSFRLSDDGVDSWGLLARGGLFNFGTAPILSEGLPPAPIESKFYDVEAGGVWRHLLPMHRELLIMATGGSASDQPFDGMAQTVFQVNAFYLMPTDRLHAWMFLVNWSNNRQFLNYVPIPGAIYSITSEDQRLHVSVGFPFDRISYDLGDGLLAKASFLGISQASAELSQALSLIWQVYIGYDWGQRSWLRVARTDPSDRLFYDEQRAMLGMRADFSHIYSLDGSLGYAFVRRAFEAHSYYSPPNGTESLGAEWEFQLALGLRNPN